MRPKVFDDAGALMALGIFGLVVWGIIAFWRAVTPRRWQSHTVLTFTVPLTLLGLALPFSHPVGDAGVGGAVVFALSIPCALITAVILVRNRRSRNPPVAHAQREAPRSQPSDRRRT
jgi:hypothetical protein